MKLLTKAIEKSLPSLAEADQMGLEELRAQIKFFLPVARWRWFVFAGERDGEDFMFYGMVFSPDCPNGELGYFTLSQLESVVIPFGPGAFRVERDKLFQPCPAEQIRHDA